MEEVLRIRAFPGGHPVRKSPGSVLSVGGLWVCRELQLCLPQRVYFSLV